MAKMVEFLFRCYCKLLQWQTSSELVDISTEGDVGFVRYKLGDQYLTVSVRRHRYVLRTTSPLRRDRLLSTYRVTSDLSGGTPPAGGETKTQGFTVPDHLPWFVPERLRRLNAVRLYLDYIHQNKP